jgi:signal transduction histidine kinase
MGVIEIVQDLSEEYGAIIELQRIIIVVSSFLMGILFLVLRTIVSRGDKIMEKRVRERLALEQKLHNVERLAHLGTMVATVSHEIKSPLGIVRSTAEILAKRMKKVAPGNEALAEIIVAETTRLNSIVMEFLDFARPQKAKLQPVDINNSIRQVLQFIEADLFAKKIELCQELDESIGKVAIDADLFYRALLNILVNGIQAMPDGGTMTVTTSVEKTTGFIAISIEDTGEGMGEDTLAEIFTPFFTNKSKGTGLGLAITKNIIDQHHGTISATSQKGKGTTFTITLP